MSLGSFQPVLQLGKGAKPLETLLLHLRRNKTLSRQHCSCKLSTGYLRLSAGYLQATCGYLQAICRLPAAIHSYLRLSTGYLRLSAGYLQATCGYLQAICRLPAAIYRLSTGYLRLSTAICGYLQAICRLSAATCRLSVEQQLKGWAFAPERPKKDLRQPPIQEPSGKKVRRRNPSVISTCVAVSQSASATIT